MNMFAVDAYVDFAFEIKILHNRTEGTCHLPYRVSWGKLLRDIKVMFMFVSHCTVLTNQSSLLMNQLRNDSPSIYPTVWPSPRDLEN